MKESLVNQKGQVLIIVLAIVAALTVYGLSLLRLTDPELKISKRQIDSTKAFYIAEAGMERAFYFVKRDGGIDNITFDQSVNFGGGDYTISKTDDISFNKWTIKSTGEYNNSTRSIQVDVEVENISVWNNAIFGGSGMTDATISGNAEFRGSLHILGDVDSDIAMDLSGTAGVGNNYEGMDIELFNRVPPLPTTIFNGEEVEFLNAKLRVKHGKVNLSGTATVGDPDEQLNDYKETVDGVYVNDGFGGNKGESNVYSDNGTENKYDLGDINIEFPSILIGSYTDPEDPETGPYDNYLEYLKYKGMRLQVDDVDVSVISADTPSFEYEEGDNYIKWVPGPDPDPGRLTIEGIIWVDNPDVGLVIGKSKGTIIFEGKGTLVSANDGADISIHCNLLSKGTSTFPADDCLGIISARDIYIATEGDANLNVMGAFYAEDKITMVKQTDLVGTFVSKYIDMGNNVPKIYQVPTLADNLPPGMPGSSINYSLIINNWREVSN